MVLPDTVIPLSITTPWAYFAPFIVFPFVKVIIKAYTVIITFIEASFLVVLPFISQDTINARSMASIVIRLP